MAIALTVLDYLTDNEIDYDVIYHDHTMRSMETAEAANIPGDKLAKCVILKDEIDYLMAVVPSTHYVELNELDKEFNGHFSMVNEDEIESIFGDCETGSIPPLGEAYFIDMIVDTTLMENNDIYLEAGDHTQLLHVTGTNANKILGNKKCSVFSRHI